MSAKYYHKAAISRGLPLLNGAYAKMNDTSSRMERRKSRTREEIISAAVELFNQKSSVEVPFESIAAKADVSRKTLYNHFSGKEQLILEIVRPIFDDGSLYIDGLTEKETVLTSDIWELCLFLWDRYGNMLSLLYNIDFEEHSSLMTLHSSFIGKFVGLVEKAEDIPHNSMLSCSRISLIIYKCFLPLLSSLSDIDDRDRLFKNAMISMLKGLVMDNTRK